ncbi:hypothetical protein CC80DRAFT_554147 [Byssothecium circinans]|uniref:Uncharacterized protein n=1 Tax=Byssothecium circinans TaxID=147558 RepID=A0A6A5TE60_9PLEO|nr:hypothetical protein CC80DRAFT_554147 [Byssothecium circinans]
MLRWVFVLLLSGLVSALVVLPSTPESRSNSSSFLALPVWIPPRLQRLDDCMGAHKSEITGDNGVLNFHHTFAALAIGQLLDHDISTDSTCELDVLERHTMDERVDRKFFLFLERCADVGFLVGRPADLVERLASSVRIPTLSSTSASSTWKDHVSIPTLHFRLDIKKESHELFLLLFGIHPCLEKYKTNKDDKSVLPRIKGVFPKIDSFSSKLPPIPGPPSVPNCKSSKKRDLSNTDNLFGVDKRNLIGNSLKKISDAVASLEIVAFTVWRCTTVPVRAATHVAQRSTNTKTLDKSQTSTRRNSTTMAPINDALAAIKSLEPGEHFSYRAIARQFNVPHSTLS